MFWIYLVQDKGQWRESCEPGNESSVFIKFWKILEQLSDWQLLKDSAPWNNLVSYLEKRET
jgi:hypothetical protein